MFKFEGRLTRAALFIIISSLAWSQIPDKFENLKVMPKDTNKQQMIQTMKFFSRSLGVRCSFCHVGEKGAPLSSYDFASDDKEHKQVTRKMMKMVHGLNDGVLKDLFGPGESARVNCYTCHRGLPSPDTLEEVLAGTYRKNGLKATVDRYRELRKTYYGEGSYNFGENTLIHLSEMLGSSDEKDTAKTLLMLNLEFFPESAYTHFTLGEAFEKQGDKAAAKTHYEKASQLLPDWPEPKKKLEALQQP